MPEEDEPLHYGAFNFRSCSEYYRQSMVCCPFIVTALNLILIDCMYTRQDDNNVCIDSSRCPWAASVQKIIVVGIQLCLCENCARHWVWTRCYYHWAATLQRSHHRNTLLHTSFSRALLTCNIFRWRGSMVIILTVVAAILWRLALDFGSQINNIHRSLRIRGAADTQLIVDERAPNVHVVPHPLEPDITT